MNRRRFAFLAVIASPLLLLPSVGAQAASGGFVDYELGGTPPNPAGTVCPQHANSPNCTNGAAEPQLRAAPDGAFYGSSENGLAGGTLAWKSTTGGLSYKSLSSPNIQSAGPVDVSPAGGDTDLAVAPAKNPAGNYNVYVASLELASVYVSTSADGGQTWKPNPLGADIPGDDREWIAADGPSKVCVSYHDVATFNIDVNCSHDAGTTFTQLGDAIDPGHAYLINNNAIGNLVIDPASHLVYQTFSGIAGPTEVPCSQLGTCGNHVVYVAVSTDGGQTFSDHVVYANPDPAVSYGHQFVNLSVDRAGNLYSVFSDNHNVFLSFSTNRGGSWSKPMPVNSGPAQTAIMPWSVAGDPGKVDIAYYGSPLFSPAGPDNYPATARWYVFFAQSLNVLRGGGFTQVAASSVIHTGGVCESGVTCAGNRDLFDDFSVAANPLTGLASIIYSDDQWSQNTSGCSQSQNGTGACDHTSIATQVSGTGIYSRHR